MISWRNIMTVLISIIYPIINSKKCRSPSTPSGIVKLGIEVFLFDETCLTSFSEYIKFHDSG